MKFTADFETITDPNDCRVWAWALCSIDDTDIFYYGTTIDTFMEFIKEHDEVSHLYFHNLKFDGEFIIYWLYHNNYNYVKDKRDVVCKSFSTLISDKGQFFSMEIGITMQRNVKIYDSLKVLPFSIAKIADAFHLPISKLEIDYEAFRSVDHELTVEEIAYIKGDVTIAAMALKQLFSQNMKKMTTASNAMAEYKEIVGDSRFSKWYPVPTYDADIRLSYRGGFTYLSERYADKDIKDGIVLDVNSLYPSVMYYSPLPYGEGVFFDGKYEKDEEYDLYTQTFSCVFELKDGYIPTVQIKGSLAFVPTEYLKTSGDEYVTLTMTNIDLEMFLEHYDVYDIDYICGWKFKSTTGLFKEYIDKWNGIKVQATIEKNGGLRTIAKLMLNSLYGKFALNPKVASKIPYLGEDDVIHYYVSDVEEREPIYIPVGTFITAWARHKTITSAQSVYDRFIYADTDSLHLEGLEEPKGLEISDTKLGAWKKESVFTRARFLRQKSYMEEINGELKITCAGMPPACYPYVSWDNFHIGASYPFRLRPMHTQGGIVLVNAPFTIRK